MIGNSEAVPVRLESWPLSSAVDADIEHDVAMLADVLHAVVHKGAGVSFIVPYSVADARGFWLDTVLPATRAGHRRVLVARLGERIVGTVQLQLDVPPNQRHRAEVMKLLVHPDARRRGIARALMQDLERVARACGRTLLTLDTWTGLPGELLYRSMGYSVAGVIPAFARGSITAALEPTTFMYKHLEGTSGTPEDIGGSQTPSA
jgi:GNAT superfamily N-acetyltransferase